MNQILLFKDENIFYCAHALRVGFFGGVFTPPPRTILFAVFDILASPFLLPQFYASDFPTYRLWQ